MSTDGTFRGLPIISLLTKVEELACTAPAAPTTTAAPTIPPLVEPDSPYYRPDTTSSEPTPSSDLFPVVSLPSPDPTVTIADPIEPIVIVNETFRGESVAILLQDITEFHSVACVTTTAPTAEEGTTAPAAPTSSVVESEVFRGESSVGTLLEDIKKFDETACSGTGTGVTGTSGTGEVAPPTTATGEKPQTVTEVGWTGVVTDEMINEFIVNKKCV